MEILEVLEMIEDSIEGGAGVPFSNRCIVDREKILELIQEMRLKLPDDIKQAKWVKEERQRILADAQKEADSIINNAEGKISALVDEHEITRKAYEKAETIIDNAKKNAREIRTGTREYADSILNKVEEILEDTIDVIKVNREELK